jgi:tetratricopeptide (TPR) repeat protein
MLDAGCVEKLAEALADGETPNWSSAEHDAEDAEARELIAELRAVASIGELFATLTTGGSARGWARALLPDGAAWGSLRVLEHVGRGRFGDVYRAWDPTLDREVALKLIARDEADDTTGSHVVEEGRLMARVQHPNVVAIYGAQRLGNATGLWMEFVRGRTLAQELDERGAFTADELATVGAALCRALQAVHDAGLVHRDVKAQNVMRDARGRVVLGDFGIGRERCDVDEGGGLAGTPVYIAPELFAGAPATAQSDIYSVGALLFCLATRQYPVPGRSLRALREAHQRGRRTTLADVAPTLPVRLIAVVERALSANPAMRFRHAEDMARALEAALRPVTKPSRQPWSAAAAVAVFAAAIAAVVTWTGWGASQPPTIPISPRDWVLVAAFDNRTGDPLLDGTLEYALTRELAQSTFVNVVPRARVTDALTLMRQSLDTRLDPDTAREVALRDGGIRALITGRIEKDGTGYKATAAVQSVVDGAALVTITETALASTSLLESIGRLSLHLRERLGETLPVAPALVPLPKVTTSSLRALQLYAQAVALQNPRGWWGEHADAAETLLRAAIEEDPRFASAHMLLAVALRQRPTPVLTNVLMHLEKAVELSADGREIERLTNEAELAHARVMWEGAAYGQSFTSERAASYRSTLRAAIAAYEAVLELEPYHYQSLIALNSLTRDLGDARVSRAATRLADARPHSAMFQREAAIAVLASDPPDRDRALAYVKRGTQVPAIDYDTAFAVSELRLFEGYEAWLRGDAAEALRVGDSVAEQIKHLPSNLVPAYVGPLYRFYIALGRLDRAAMLARRQSKNAETIVAVARADQSALRATLARLYPTVTEAAGVSSAYVEAGLLSEARQALEIIRRRADGVTIGQPPFTNTLYYRALLEGQILRAEARLLEAIGVLEDLLPHRPVGDSQWALATLTLAKAYAANGNPAKAISLLEAAPLRINLVMWSTNYNMHWLQMRDELAQLYMKVGRHADANAVDAHLARLLAVADEDHPIKRRIAARETVRRSRVGNVTPGSPDWVVVSTLERMLQDDVHQAAIEYALTARLDQSSRVRVASRTRVDDALRTLQQHPGARIDRAMAREVARVDHGIRWILAPRLARNQTGQRLIIDIVDPRSGDVTATLAGEAGSLDRWPDLVESMTRRLREHYGEPVSVDETPVDPAVLSRRAQATELLQAAVRSPVKGRRC